jgi:phage-related protein (TIGR01555 family)
MRKVKNGTWKGRLPAFLADKNQTSTSKKKNNSSRTETPISSHDIPVITTELLDKVADNQLNMQYNFYYDKDKQSSMLFDSISDLPLTNTGSMDPNRAIGIRNSRWITFNIPAIDALSRSNPYVRKASKYLATKALQNGIDLNSPRNQLSSEEELIVHEFLKKQYGAKRDVLSKGYIYGGSAGLMWFSDQQDPESLKKPLIIKDIKKGSYLGIKPLARWFQVEPALDKGLIKKVGPGTGFSKANKIGMPMYYHVNLSGGLAGDQTRGEFLVHASRLLLYNEDQPSFIETQIERFWGPSSIEVAWNDLSKDSRLWGAVTKSAEKNNIGVLKINGLALATQVNENVLNRFEARMALMKNGSANNVIPIDDKDDFQFVSSSFAGMNEILRINNSRVAGAYRVPVGLFFPTSEGDDEDKSYMASHTELVDNQNRIVRDWYDVELAVIIKSEIGRTIKNLMYSFNPIENQTQKERAEMAEINSKTIKNLYEIGAIDKASSIKMTDVIGKDPSYLSQNINEKYREYVLNNAKSGNFETSNSDQIEVAKTLNQLKGDDEKGLAGVSSPQSKIEGKLKGGDPQVKKKPLKNQNLNPEKDKK